MTSVADLSPLRPERRIQLAVRKQPVLQTGEELEQVASSREANWRPLDAVLTHQHHRPPAVHCRRYGSLLSKNIYNSETLVVV